MVDIGNAYLAAVPQRRFTLSPDQEFGDEQAGHTTLVIYKALYGSTTTSLRTLSVLKAPSCFTQIHVCGCVMQQAMYGYTSAFMWMTSLL